MEQQGQRFEIELLERLLYVETRPGLPGWRKPERALWLLIEQMEVEPEDAVIELACGYGLGGMVAALLAADGQVTLVDDDLLAVECARDNLRQNRIHNASVQLTADYAEVPAEAYDVALLHAPAYRGNRLVRQLIGTAHRVLRPGGRLYLAGGMREGLPTFQRWAEELLGPAEVSARGGGQRVLRLVKAPGPVGVPQAAAAEAAEFEEVVRGHRFCFRSRPGVFSHGEVDQASRLLLEVVEIGPAAAAGGRILDLGCGYGLLGIVAARLAPQSQVVLLDRSQLALECARENLQRNGIGNAEAFLGDGVEPVRGRRFDLVLCNPPFHAGRAADRTVGEHLLREGAAVLAPGGRFYVVCSEFLPYERVLAEEVGRVDEVARRGGFKVLVGHEQG